jgi:hypothetical protein
MPFYVEEAKKKRHCTKCKAGIKKGESCLTFRRGSGMYSVSVNMCRLCVEKALGDIVLAQSEDDNVLELKLGERFKVPKGESVIRLKLEGGK